ncbi:uncharacterized protein FIBRA_02930 [Fibroporia radiculosa]|uniref:F-box domain-containing protein n=1 Tax=Fibroporia radiculosa TaxID=599839 RepID=J4H245_9APHY|nr:uncharacterized protein FIBRA_02930 [Fibroporia radiculosa]CCM00884.1 predicted protein [Fibroporia radiculosa]
MPVGYPCPRLVDDLIPFILESDNHWWNRDLKRLALISPAWLLYVRKRLYAHPTLRSYRACILLARSLTENVCLLPLLQGIELRPGAGGTARDGLTEEAMAGLRFMFTLSGLRSLTLGGDLAVGAERFLHALSNTQSIVRLSIDGDPVAWNPESSQCTLEPPSLEWDEVFAAKFMRLRSLRLSNLELSLFESAPSCPRLAELSLHNVQIVQGALSDLCRDSGDALRTLSVTSSQPELTIGDDVGELLDSCSNIENLRLEVSEGPGSEVFLGDDFPDCPAIRQLCLSGLSVNAQTLEFIGQSCKNIELLAVLGRHVRITPDDWITFLASAALPSLRELATPSGTDHPPFTYWSRAMHAQVQRACGYRKVALSSSVCLLCAWYSSSLTAFN